MRTLFRKTLCMLLICVLCVGTCKVDIHAAKNSAWMEAYLQVIQQFPATVEKYCADEYLRYLIEEDDGLCFHFGNSRFGYELVYLNDDDMPELAARSNNALWIYTYINGQVKCMAECISCSDWASPYGECVTYLPKGNLILQSNDFNGNAFRYYEQITPDMSIVPLYAICANHDEAYQMGNYEKVDNLPYQQSIYSKYYINTQFRPCNDGLGICFYEDTPGTCEISLNEFLNYLVDVDLNNINYTSAFTPWYVTNDFAGIDHTKIKGSYITLGEFRGITGCGSVGTNFALLFPYNSASTITSQMTNIHPTVNPVYVPTPK